MARFIFNQEVKHGANTYSEGDVVNFYEDIAEYFASNSWGHIEGQDEYSGEPIVNPDIPPSPPKDIVLEVHNSVINTEDSNNG